jgi:hypothetical protein
MLFKYSSILFVTKCRVKYFNYFRFTNQRFVFDFSTSVKVQDADHANQK